MYTYRFLPHTADICLQLEADSVDELFLAGLLGMNEILCEGGCNSNVIPSIHHTVEIRSIDLTALLIDFLSETLTRSYVENSLFCQLEIIERNNTSLKAVIQGRPVEYFEDDIKAVTYHEAEIKLQENGKWVTPLIFDI